MLSDLKRRLKERWDDPAYTEPALKRVRIHCLTGLRRIKDLEVEFRFPVVAIAGKNGTGKSTVLGCLACAYHGADMKKVAELEKEADASVWKAFGLRAEEVPR